MMTLLLVAFIGMCTGICFVFEMTPFGMIAELVKQIKKIDTSILARIQLVTKIRKKKGLSKLMEDTKVILETTGRSSHFYTLIVIALSMMVLGAIVAIGMGNFFLLPILGGGFFLMPFWYMKLTATRWKKELNNELETTLSIITASYLRSESILIAIEENIEYIHPPLYDVFKSFLTQTKLINSNIKLALTSLKTKVDSTVFHEWLDAVIVCQEDKNLNSTLTPIVSKLSDMKIVSAELDYHLYEPVKEFITMAVLLVANIPLMYFLNRDWFNTLMHETFGKIVLAGCGMLLFVSIAGVVRLSKPVEYRR